MNFADPVLVEQVLNGNKDAFEEIVHRYQHRVYYVALTRMRDRHEADDLAQETFIQAYRKLASYDPRHSFRNWLLTICVNLTKNRLRGNARRRKAHREHSESSLVTSRGSDQHMLGVMEALHEIPEKLRVPLVLKHVEGFSYEEIAAIMKIGLSAAKMRVKRGRDQLVEALNLETRNP